MPKLKMKAATHHPSSMNFQLDHDFSGMVVILGANGAGKTTFLQLIHGMRSSEVFWDNENATSSKLKRGFVPQTPIFLSGSLFQNMVKAAKLSALKKRDIEHRIAKLADEYGLRHLLAQKATTLSGGESARAALARACLHAPKILLLDEVTAHLDPENTATIEADLKNFTKEKDHCAFFVTHSLSQARRLADHVIFIDHGEIKFAGKAPSFWENQTDQTIQQFISGELP